MFLQLNHPEKVDGLCLINCSASRSSWTEWGYQKVMVSNFTVVDNFI